MVELRLGLQREHWWSLVLALAPSLPQELRPRWERAIGVLRRRLGARTGSSSALRALVLFHQGSYLLFKQVFNWKCIGQCISQC